MIAQLCSASSSFLILYVESDAAAGESLRIAASRYSHAHAPPASMMKPSQNRMAACIPYRSATVSHGRNKDSARKCSGLIGCRNKASIKNQTPKKKKKKQSQQKKNKERKTSKS